MRHVRILRQLLGIGHDEFVKASGVSPRELIRLERREVLPTPETCEKIDKGFLRCMQRRLKELDEELKEEADAA